MIRTSTVIYIILLLGLVGAYFYLRNRAQPADAEPTAEPSVEVSYLFSGEEDTPSGIRIESASGEVVGLARDAENAWVLTEPIEANADQGAAEAAASQVTAMRVLDSALEIEPAIVGLDDPEYVLTIKFTSGAEQKVDIGVITPTESGYYVRDAGGKVSIVSRSAIDALLGLLDNPPYLETPIPTVAATETLTPLPASSTPGATSTP